MPKDRFDRIEEILDRVAKRLDNVAKEQKKTDEQLKKTDKEIDKVAKDIDGGLGGAAEGLTAPSVPNVLAQASETMRILNPNGFKPKRYGEIDKRIV